MLLRDLKIQNIPIIDSTNYMSKIASKAKVSEKTYRIALEMLAKVKKNHMSYGKDPLTAAVLYAACQKAGAANPRLRTTINQKKEQSE